MKTLKNLDVENKKVLLRVDFNVPLSNGRVSEYEDWKIKATIPTIEYLLDKKSKIILLSHLGRPKDWRQAEYSLAPIAEYLETALNCPVRFIDDYLGEDAKNITSEMAPGDIILLENLRFHAGEKDNDSSFAKKLASLGDVYINDAFGDSHRAHASIVEIPKYLPSAAGLLLEKEVEILENVKKKPKHPLIVIIGGVKISTKIKLIKNFLGKADHLILGGALVNTVLQAQGVAIGQSITEKKMIEEVRGLDFTNTKLHIPVDVIVSPDTSGESLIYITGVGNVNQEDMILDIGPDTYSIYERIIKNAGMVVWNGPMGFAEVGAFSNGTKAVAKAISESMAYSVVGGGDTVAIIRKMGLADKVRHLSTGGGAMLEFLSGNKLPGIEALKSHNM